MMKENYEVINSKVTILSYKEILNNYQSLNSLLKNSDFGFLLKNCVLMLVNYSEDYQIELDEEVMIVFNKINNNSYLPSIYDKNEVKLLFNKL